MPVELGVQVLLLLLGSRLWRSGRGHGYYLYKYINIAKRYHLRVRKTERGTTFSLLSHIFL